MMTTDVELKPEKAKEHEVGTQFGKQQYREHRQHGDYRYPSIEIKTQKDD